MATVGISEFTFGFSFLYEQTRQRWGNLSATPVLPNLQKEAEVGWDAQLPTKGTDFYYQFKMSEYLERSNAKYIVDRTYGGSYYRIALHKKHNNRQHMRLREHVQAHPNTYYVAPEMHDKDAFNSAFLRNQVTSNSRMIPLRECNDINDGDQHFITYQPGTQEWIQHSEEKRHGRSYSGKELGSMYEETRPTLRKIDQEYAANLLSGTIERAERITHLEHAELPAVLPLQEPGPHRETRGFVLLQVGQVLSTFFGLTLVLVGTRE